ncbi:hypothetical protein VYU27_006565 [Nannochloropsis oceanica]
MRRSGKAMTFSSTIFSAFRLPITVSRRVFSSSQPSPTTPATSSPPNTKHDSLLAYALDRVRQGGTPHGANLVAYSGGVDSSLVAALVKRAFPTNSLACIGLSASLPSAQLSLAREIAAYIDIPLKEVTTAEGDTPGYVANRGLSCFHCKTHLYTALQAVAAEAQNYREEVHHAKTNISLATETGANAQGGGNKPSFVVTLFNGTNADDRQDPTRVGLKAARNFRVRSPIDHLNKNEVRKLAQALGLPNWQHAASPCLRSRLALGVPAVEEHLRKVEAAEELVRATLGQGGREGGAAGLLGVHHNVRVRLLSEGKAVIEVDAELLESAASFFLAMEGRMKAELGFADVTLRAFKSGSVNGLGGTTRIRNKGHGGEEVEQVSASFASSSCHRNCAEK